MTALLRSGAALTCVLAMWAGAPSDAHAVDICPHATRGGQPEAATDDPLAASARGVWQRVFGVFYASTGRATELAILDRTATLTTGGAFPASAAICPTSDTPKIYVTYALLERIRDRKLYDDNFLAMVLGHELGHRINDFDWAGKVTTTQQSSNVETNADARGAFFAAAAGYRTRRLACDDVMNLFLQVEANLKPEVASQRKGILAEVLQSFDVYESLYDAASALVFWDTPATRKLLGWVNFHMQQHVQPIAEFKVLEALALMMDGIDDSEWQEKLWVPQASPKALRCTPVFPAHTAFWDEVLAGERVSATRRGAHPLLKKAKKLLGEALQMGASELAVHSATACVHFYDAEFKQAERAAKRARRFLPDDAPPALKRALDGNEALFAYARWMQENPAPDATSDAATQRVWAKKLSGVAKNYAAHPSLAAYLDGLKRYPAVAAASPAAPTITDFCPAGAPEVDYTAGPAMMAPMPDIPAAGGCPCGWSELHRLHDDETPGDPTAGVLTCVPAGWGIGQRYIDVKLPTSNVAQRMMLVDKPAGPLSSLGAWTKHCSQFEKRGVSDAGQQVFAGACADLGAPVAVLLADDRCRVQRMVILDYPE